MSTSSLIPRPRLYLAPSFLTQATCVSIRTAMGRGVAEPAEVFGSGASRDLRARRAEIIDVDLDTLDTVETTLDAARNAIAAYYHQSLVSREGAGFLRYGPGGFYRRHRDWAVDATWPRAARRLISLIVFLNSSCSQPASGEFCGGELIIFPESPGMPVTSEALTVVPRQGTLVAFEALTSHEVRPVRGGTRDVIVDWYY